MATMRYAQVAIIIVVILFAVILLGCATTPMIGAPLDHKRLRDGIYEGSYQGGPNKALVEVTIKNGRIDHIEIVEHWALRGKKAELPVLRDIIEQQSTRVDAVSGATNSSRVIMNAVQRAVEKAYLH